MLEIFSNPGYLALAAALISVPIIIHLINRMRFRRVRWAAMEFLLKAQKRNRRRLIVEQLLLLALRCLLVAMVGLLVARFVGFSWANLQGKTNLHLVLLDDTPSMGDFWKEEGELRDCFQVAKKDVLLDKIVKSLGQAGPADKLMVLPYSQVALEGEAAGKVYDHLNDANKLEEVTRDIESLQLTKVHVAPLAVLRKAQEVMADHAESQVSLHVLSDFRNKEWNLPEGEKLYKALLDLAKAHKDLKVRLIDTAHPYRTTGQTGYPQSHDNVGIVDLRPGTRVAGKNMPVNFTVTMANYSGRETEVIVVVQDEAGREMLEVDFNPPMPIKLPPTSLVTANFDLRFNPAVQPNQVYFAQISARLRNAALDELQNDGLLIDNVRHAAVEVRDKVPVLVIDGEGAKGREDGKDSFFIKNSLISVPGASYQVVHGDDLGGGTATKALERPDLFRFPTIFLLNVRELTAKQLTNLENFIRDGGGVVFFLGPDVSPKYYNQALYKDGKGIFPVPLRDTYYPPASEEPLPPRAGDTPQLLLRDEQFANFRSFPIFGAMLEKPEHREPLKDLPIKRYFQVPRGAWRPEPGRVFELATLPNDLPVTFYQQAVIDMVRGETLRNLLASAEYVKFRPALERHFKEIEDLVGPTSEKKAYHLALAFDQLLSDRGNEMDREASPNLTEFWANSDPKIQSLRKEITTLREQVHYGDPFIVSQSFGNGKVVAIMSTAGKEWNEWGGGSAAAVLYTPFIWEMQNYLSSLSVEGNLTVGTPLEVKFDAEQFKNVNEQLKLTRYFYQPQERSPVKTVKISEEPGQEVNGQLTFRLSRTLEPGLYVSTLTPADAPEGKPPLAVFGHVFNVDTPNEGPLQRVSHDQLDRELVRSGDLPEGTIRLEGPGIATEDLIERRSDFSESPLLFLFFLCVLIAEQALAVHLSFHLKASESDTLAQTTRVTAKAA